MDDATDNAKYLYKTDPVIENNNKGNENYKIDFINDKNHILNTIIKEDYSKILNLSDKLDNFNEFDVNHQTLKNFQTKSKIEFKAKAHMEAKSLGKMLNHKIKNADDSCDKFLKEIEEIDRSSRNEIQRRSTKLSNSPDRSSDESLKTNRNDSEVNTFENLIKDLVTEELCPKDQKKIIVSINEALNNIREQLKSTVPPDERVFIFIINFQSLFNSI